MLALRLALTRAASGDTGPGGLVELTGEEHPLVIAGDKPLASRPDGSPRGRISYEIVAAPKIGGTGGRDVMAIFSIPYDRTREGNYIERAEQVRERLKDLYTFTTMLAQGVDTVPVWVDEGDRTGDEGGLELYFEFRNTRVVTP